MKALKKFLIVPVVLVCLVAAPILTGCFGSAHKHDWGAWGTVSAVTCTAKGVEKRTCAKDSSHTETQDVGEPLGHEMDWFVTTPGTCAAGGVETYACKRPSCSHSDGTRAISGAHDWTVWGDSTATCTTAGKETRTCDICDETETRDVPAGHAWSAWGNNTATCLAAGTESRTCTLCTEPDTRSTPARGHAWSTWAVTSQPTATEPGERERACTRSGCTVTETEPIPPTGGGSIGDDVEKDIETWWNARGAALVWSDSADFFGTRIYGAAYSGTTSSNVLDFCTLLLNEGELIYNDDGDVGVIDRYYDLGDYLLWLVFEPYNKSTLDDASFFVPNTSAGWNLYIEIVYFDIDGGMHEDVFVMMMASHMLLEDYLGASRDWQDSGYDWYEAEYSDVSLQAVYSFISSFTHSSMGFVQKYPYSDTDGTWEAYGHGVVIYLEFTDPNTTFTDPSGTLYIWIGLDDRSDGINNMHPQLSASVSIIEFFLFGMGGHIEWYDYDYFAYYADYSGLTEIDFLNFVDMLKMEWNELLFDDTWDYGYIEWRGSLTSSGVTWEMEIAFNSAGIFQLDLRVDLGPIDPDVEQAADAIYSFLVDGKGAVLWQVDWYLWGPNGECDYSAEYLNASEQDFNDLVTYLKSLGFEGYTSGAHHPEWFGSGNGLRITVAFYDDYYHVDYIAVIICTE